MNVFKTLSGSMNWLLLLGTLGIGLAGPGTSLAEESVPIESRPIYREAFTQFESAVKPVQIAAA